MAPPTPATLAEFCGLDSLGCDCLRGRVRHPRRDTGGRWKAPHTTRHPAIPIITSPAVHIPGESPRKALAWAIRHALGSGAPSAVPAAGPGWSTVAMRVGGASVCAMVDRSSSGQAELRLRFNRGITLKVPAGGQHRQAIAGSGRSCNRGKLARGGDGGAEGLRPQPRTSPGATGTGSRMAPRQVRNSDGGSRDSPRTTMRSAPVRPLGIAQAIWKRPRSVRRCRPT